jgi:phage terminase large subunit-like protein
VGNWNSGRRSPTVMVQTPVATAPRGPQAAAKVKFINSLTHTKGPFAGQPFRLRRWQERGIVRPLFATDKSGKRRYRTALVMMPRKNGKTELAAALAIDGLLNDGEVGAEVYSAAADRDQAALVFNVAAQMIRNHPELAGVCDIHESTKKILHRKSGSVYRVLSAESYSKHGLNSSRIIYDELASVPNREMFDVLSTSTGARAQPLMIVISTAGYDRQSILWELYSHGKNVLANPALDPSFLPVIYEAPLEADWTSERVWRAANPALGDFRMIDEMRVMAHRAREIPAQENVFRRLYLNQWTEQAERWIPLEAWDACRAPAPRWAGPCYLGLDLAATTDLTALVGVYPDADGPGFAVRAAAFLPGDQLRERANRDRVPYDQWARDGHLIVTPGNVVDYERIRAEVTAWADGSDVREVAFDPWNATDLISRLQAHDGLPCVPIRQGFSALSAPTKSLEKAVLSRALRHDGHPVLRWCLSNVAVESDHAGNMKPSKKLSTARIDLVAALVMAVDRLDRNRATPAAPSVGIYVFGGAP